MNRRTTRPESTQPPPSAVTPASAPAVQRRARACDEGFERQEAALAPTGEVPRRQDASVPHLDRIQRAFGSGAAAPVQMTPHGERQGAARNAGGGAEEHAPQAGREGATPAPNGDPTRAPWAALPNAPALAALIGGGDYAGAVRGLVGALGIQHPQIVYDFAPVVGTVDGVTSPDASPSMRAVTLPLLPQAVATPTPADLRIYIQVGPRAFHEAEAGERQAEAASAHLGDHEAAGEQLMLLHTTLMHEHTHAVQQLNRPLASAWQNFGTRWKIATANMTSGPANAADRAQGELDEIEARCAELENLAVTGVGQLERNRVILSALRDHFRLFSAFGAAVVQATTARSDLGNRIVAAMVAGRQSYLVFLGTWQPYRDRIANMPTGLRAFSARMYFNTTLGYPASESDYDRALLRQMGATNVSALDAQIQAESAFFAAPTPTP